MPSVKNKIRPYTWLKPIILATWEAENKRIIVQGQPRQKAHKTLSQSVASVVAHACHPSHAGKYKQKDNGRGHLVIKQDPISKVTSQKQGWSSSSGRAPA
jgi:hypothetical protein